MATVASLVVQIGADIADLRRNVEKANATLDSLEKAAGKTQSSLSRMSLATSQAIGTFFGGQALAIVGKMTDELGTFVKRGAEIDGLRASFGKLSAGVKQDGAAMLEAMQAGTRGLVAEYDLLKSANKAMLLGLPVSASEMGDLAEAASTLGRAMGLSATKSIDDMITALGRSSPQILDNLGITVKVSEANEAYAKTLRKSVDALTETEKKTAFYIATMAAARAKTEEIGPPMLLLTDRLAAAWVRVGDAITGAVAALNKVLGAAAGAVPKAPTTAGTASNFGAAKVGGTDYVNIHQQAAAEMAKAIASMPGIAPTAARGAAEAIRSAADALGEFTAQYGTLGGAIARNDKAIAMAAADAARVSELTGARVAEDVAAWARQIAAAEKGAGITAAGWRVAGAALEKLRGEGAELSATLEDVWAKFSGGTIPIGTAAAALTLLTGKAINLSAAYREVVTAADRAHAAAAGGMPVNKVSAAGILGPGVPLDFKAPSVAGALGKSLGGALGGFAGGLGPTVLAALTGGGSVSQSIGSLAGSQIGGALKDSLGGALTKGLGEKVGGALASMIPGVGAIIGPLIGKGLGWIGGKIAGLFTGGEGGKTKKLRSEWMAEIGGLAGAHKKIAELGNDPKLKTAFEKLYHTGKIKEFQAAAEQFDARMREIQGDRAAEELAAREKLTAAVERYGFSLEELGPAWQRQALHDQATQLIEDFTVLTASGIDVATVGGKMGESVSKYLALVKKTGGEVPQELQNMLKGMLAGGHLVDEFGNKLENLDGVSWAMSLREGFSGVIAKLDELIRKITGGLTPALEGLSVGGISPSGGEGDSHWRVARAFGLPIPAMAEGGIVRRPTVALIGEAGPEAVIPLDRAGGMGGGTLILELDGQAFARVALPRLGREAKRVRLRA